MVEPIEAIFPGLRNSKLLVTSPANRDYNCIDNDAIFWPASVVWEETLDAFVAAFATLGYAPCSGEEPEHGFEKVAIFAKAGVPSHAGWPGDDAEPVIDFLGQFRRVSSSRVVGQDIPCAGGLDVVQGAGEVRMVRQRDRIGTLGILHHWIIFLGHNKRSG